MKRHIFSFTLASLIGITSVLADGQQSAHEAKSRLDGIATVFSEHGLNSFGILNGVSHGGSGGEISSKGSGTEDIENTAFLKSSDPQASLFCVKDGRWAVQQMRPLDVNKDAINSWTDANGKKLVPDFISAIRKSGNGVATVEYTVAVDGVKDSKTGGNLTEKRTALLYSSAALLGKKNDTGSKFFCGTTFIAR